MSRMPDTFQHETELPIWLQQTPVATPCTATPEPVPVSGDWALLLAAVQDRLLRAEQGCRGSALSSVGDRCAGGAQPVLLECAAALGQLHHMFALEVSRHEGLALEVFDARTALAQARAELLGTRAGERRARHLAQHDSLTTLPNRSHFMDALTAALAGRQSPDLAVMFLDLDAFKPINDQHGHAVGDELLRIVAMRITHVVRARDVVGRLGGDEFACLLHGLSDAERLGALACEIVEAVSAPCRIGNLTLNVRPSIGIARCPTDGDSAQALLNNADLAMYQAKKNGIGHAFCSA